MSFNSDAHCWFHLHTNLTDGELSAEQIFQLAKRYEAQKLYFLEHVRESPSYSTSEFISAVHSLSRQYAIEADIGFEAKILPNGKLDINREDLEKANYLGVAEHSFPADVELFLQSWKSVLKEMEKISKEKPVIWVHPGLFFRKKQLLCEYRTQYLEMLYDAVDRGILLEKNLRYQLLDYETAEKFPHVTGIDFHKTSDIISVVNTSTCELLESV